jgi:cellulose synthase/poly-beta-1,6-N-acetylglucosamine synthase-like glycosyltransferase
MFTGLYLSRFHRLYSGLSGRNHVPFRLFFFLIYFSAFFSSAHAAGLVGWPTTPQNDFVSSLFVSLSCIFFFGFIRSCWRSFKARETLRRQVLSPYRSLSDLRLLCSGRRQSMVRFAIMIPAKGESRVIANTLRHISSLHYDLRYLSVYVITDDREVSEDGDLVTADIARVCAAQLNQSLGRDVIKVLSVPDSYDGQHLPGRPAVLSSSKGRALNYALEVLQDQVLIPDLIGILDADGRLHPDVLVEAAWRYIEDGSRVLQGPVFQISNLDRVDLFGVMAGIELSVHHLSSLASRLQSRRHYPRFLAGTNYFICPRLLFEVGGWNSEALVEDAELGLRLFFLRGVRADWLPCPELEQTSPSLSVYLRQRHRWALGHLQLLPQILQSPLGWLPKARLFWQVTYSLLSCPFTVVLPVLGWILALFYALPFHSGWTEALSFLLAALSLYTWDDFGRGLRLLNWQSPRPLSWARIVLYSLSLMLLMPCLMVVQLIPRLRALVHFLSSSCAKSRKFVWYKTERSVEDIIV